MELTLPRMAGNLSVQESYNFITGDFEGRYFTPIPGTCGLPREFELPSDPAQGPKDRQLLGALFDLVRNGHAHQYQQIVVDLTDGKYLAVSLDGVGKDWP